MPPCEQEQATPIQKMDIYNRTDLGLEAKCIISNVLSKLTTDSKGYYYYQYPYDIFF